MRVLLTAINSQYIHMNLAVWYLYAAVKEDCDAQVLECNINQPITDIFDQILLIHPDVLCFSCYIWNIGMVERLCQDFKKAEPEMKIILGGPEVSFAQGTPDYADALLRGEGEHTLPALLKGQSAPASYQRIEDLDSIKSPYTPEFLQAAQNRIVYYESSRGCPFSCSYCLSSATGGVRYFSLERTKRDLQTLIDARVPLVKFVDRTFNCNPQRTAALLTWILEQDAPTRFHFEIGADLLTPEILALLQKARPGQFQVEAGIQSVHGQTLDAIQRKTDLRRLFENVTQLLKMQTVHVHLDLIAGLPYEDYATFARSFDAVFALHPHQLQLGFLKLLKGCRIREQEEGHAYRYRSYPPYEIISNAYLPARQLTELRGVEAMVERYYNSGAFLLSLRVLLPLFPSPFAFFEALGQFSRFQGTLYRPLKPAQQFAQLYEFAKQTPGGDGILASLCNAMKVDFASKGYKGERPAFLTDPIPRGFKEMCYHWCVENGLKDRYSHLRFEPIDGKVYLWDTAAPRDLWERIPYTIVDLTERSEAYGNPRV